jgi:hypothetical protein
LDVVVGLNGWQQRFQKLIAILVAAKPSIMKNILYVLLIINLLISCKSNTKQIPAKDSTINTQSVNQAQALIKRFKPIIQGVWVEKDYIDKIIKTRSPLASEDKVGYITTMYINTDHINGDSLIVPTGDNHEGSQITIKFYPGKTPSSIRISEGGELGYTTEKGDTIMFYTRLDDQTKKIIKTEFIKVLNKQPDDDLGYGLNYAINKSLIAGNYILTDTLNSNVKVTFTNDGKVSGFLNHSKYKINIDLNTDPMDNLDEINFDISSKRPASFSYKFNGDTLNLYDAYPNADSTQLILGKRIYKLIRQK